MRARESIVVLIADANRRIEAFGQGHGGRDRTREDHARAVQDHRELGRGQQGRGLCDCVIAARGAFKLDHHRQVDVDDLGEVIAREVDLGRGRLALGLQDHAVQHFGHAGGVTHLFLIANHVLEKGHLLNFLEAALTDGLVGRLRGDQQKRRVVPVSGFHGGHKVGDAGAVLSDHHRHLAAGAGVAIGHHPA